MAPPLLSPAARASLRMLEPVLEKWSSAELEALQPRRVQLEGPYRHWIRTVAHGLGAGRATLYVTRHGTNLCLPLQGGETSLLLSETLMSRASAGEMQALLWLGFGISRARLGAPLRETPDRWTLLVEALRVLVGPETETAPPAVRDTAQRMAKLLSRKQLRALTAPALDMLGDPQFSPVAIRSAVLHHGARIALLATGDVASTLGALSHLVGEVWQGEVPQRLAVLERQPALRALFDDSFSRSWHALRALVFSGGN